MSTYRFVPLILQTETDAVLEFKMLKGYIRGTLVKLLGTWPLTFVFDQRTQRTEFVAFYLMQPKSRLLRQCLYASFAVTLRRLRNILPHHNLEQIRTCDEMPDTHRVTKQEAEKLFDLAEMLRRHAFLLNKTAIELRVYLPEVSYAVV